MQPSYCHAVRYCDANLLQSIVYLKYKTYSLLLSVHHYCLYCQDSYTCFPLCPEYRTRAKIFCTKLILKYRCFRSNAAHIPIITSLLGLSVLVTVASLRIDRRTGACISNSLISLSHVKSDRSDKYWLPKIYLAAGLHNV